MIEVDTVTLPSYWASALVNGDYTGLDDAEIERLTFAVDLLAADGWEISSPVEDSERFTWSYRLYDAQADASGGDVCDYTIIRQLSTPAGGAA